MNRSGEIARERISKSIIRVRYQREKGRVFLSLSTF